MRFVLVGRNIGIVAALGLSWGCVRDENPAVPEHSSEETTSPIEKQAPASGLDYAETAVRAVGDPSRPKADRNADQRRQPAKTIAFFQIATGMTIFELEAGSGYYTELFSRAVTPGGGVIMQNPEGFLQFVGDEVNARLENGRLGNVRQSVSNFDQLDAADSSVDVVTWVQGPHELYFRPSEGVTLGDPALTFQEIFRILKPGGVFGVVDHSAETGAPQVTGNDLHRIDRNIVVELAEEAGLTLEEEATFLANKNDPLDISVFDKSIRGHTDQFVLRFRKSKE